jgi:26S proteasome regulatory subunit N8
MAPSNSPVAVVQNSLVTVHPLVLLSVVDHYNRVAKGTKKRALGVLLGQAHGNKVNVANSFAGKSYLSFVQQGNWELCLSSVSMIQMSGGEERVLQPRCDGLTCMQTTFLHYSLCLVPFEEDEKDPSVWFLDHNYVEAMNDMFRKVNGKMNVVTLLLLQPLCVRDEPWHEGGSSMRF